MAIKKLINQTNDKIQVRFEENMFHGVIDMAKSPWGEIETTGFLVV